ncbi:FGGY family carbohydrate kinase [Oceanispirochaeta sp.]|jgi:xylulokinase|uniref:xylulokinase n=1 Tax=Oceanispirochaeta sp. TaxID=2035350 RepID=UPI002623AEEC|nr:FGGY family carbohydrate kinase [Oceanispirochaeta sp.]MDA3959067.1 FGGY family carbohydrate kinase [Oceanispirochaeta sp.]
MSKALLLGIDIGTQGVKSSLFDQDGACRASAFIPSRLYQPEPGITEEDPEFQLDSVCKSISECVQTLSPDEKTNIKCLAIDGQMAGVVGVGEDGMAVTPYDSWLDTRCAPYIKIMKEEAEQEIIRKTGNPPSFNHGPKILWWKVERPDVYDNIVSFVQPAGYAAMRLCNLKGKDGFIDRTYLHFSGFADNQNNKWDKGLIETFGIDESKLPRIVSPTELIGEMTPEMAARCGLSSSIPVAAGCGDTAASFLSCGAVEPGICVDVAGTASVFAATTDKFCFDSETQVMGCGASVTEGLWHPYAYINGGGMNIEWFLLEVLGRDKSDPARFDGLEDTTLAPREDDPLFIPHMAGRVSPSQPYLKGTFAGLSWNHTNKHMFQAVMESVALEYGVYRKSLMKMLPGVELMEMRITGGGDNSPFWKEMKSGVLQVPVVSIKQKHGAPMGAAIVAGVACGVLSSTREAADSWISLKNSTSCDPALYPHFKKRTVRYEALLDVMNGFYSEES